MELIFRICLFISGVINILPSILAFLPNKISKSYGINVPDPNYELLLRHRALLLGIIGGIMIFSAISKTNYSISVCIGLISMVSFVILFKIIKGEINPELNKVMRVDIIGIFILLIGFALYQFN